MKEIGGYLEIENLHGLNEWYKDKIRFNTDRSAFLYLAREKKIKKVYLPFFYVIQCMMLVKKKTLKLNFIISIGSLSPILIKL